MMRHMKRAWQAFKKALRTDKDDSRDTDDETMPTYHHNTLDGSEDCDSHNNSRQPYGQDNVADEMPEERESSLVRRSITTTIGRSEKSFQPESNFQRGREAEVPTIDQAVLVSPRNGSKTTSDGVSSLQQESETENPPTDQELLVSPSNGNDSICDGVSSRASSTENRLPSRSSGIVPHGYQRALANRLRFDRLSPGGDSDIKKHRPIFLHDAMMFPGSLASLIGEGSASDIVPYLTPARLRNFHAHTHSTTRQPMLIQSVSPSSSVYGIILLGFGKKARQHIDRHYQPDSQRIIADVQFEVEIPVPRAERQSQDDRWKRERRTAGAYVYLWAGVASAYAMFETSDSVGWRIEDYTQQADDGDINVVPVDDPSWQMRSLPALSEDGDDPKVEDKGKAGDINGDWTGSPSFGEAKTQSYNSTDGFGGW